MKENENTPPVNETGNTTAGMLEGTPKEIAEKIIAFSKEKSNLYFKYENEGALTTEQILAIAFSSKGKKDLQNLFEGNYIKVADSHDEALKMFAGKLAFWTANNPLMMEEIIRKSGLMTEALDKTYTDDGKTYMAWVIDKAIQNTKDVYTPTAGCGVFERDGKYIRKTEDKTKNLTNFIIIPHDLIQTDEDVQFKGEFIGNNKSYLITFLPTDFNNVQKLRNMLNRKTLNLSFYGSDSDLEPFKNYVSSLPWKIIRGVKELGIHIHNGKPVFVSTNGAFAANGEPVTDIIQTSDSIGIKSEIMNGRIMTVEEFKKIGAPLFLYNEPMKTVSIMAWIAGCFIKGYLKSEGIKYPHLFLVGEAGSGKSTSLEAIILKIFAVPVAFAASQLTNFTLAKNASSSNIIPLAIDEFKPSTMDKNKLNTLKNFLRDSYDDHNAVRGKADQTVNTYMLLAPVVIAGEESAAEPAIRERSIELLFSKADIENVKCNEAFTIIKKSPNDLTNFGATLLNTALKTDPAKVKSWYEEGNNVFNSNLPPRIISNLKCCYTGLKLLNALCEEYGIAWNDVFPINFNNCVQYLQDAVKDFLLDGGLTNKSVLLESFEIMSRMPLQKKQDFDITTDRNSGKRTLYINSTTVYDSFTKYKKDHSIPGEVLSRDEFIRQLKRTDYLTDISRQHKLSGKNIRCWALDYDLLSKKCDVEGFLSNYSEENFSESSDNITSFPKYTQIAPAANEGNDSQEKIVSIYELTEEDFPF